VRAKLLPLAALTLSACGGGSTDESAARTGQVDVRNASVAEVARQTRAAGDRLRFQPGRWQTTTEVIEAEVPGVPPQMVDQLRQQMMAKSTITSCMTPEQAQTPTEKMFGGEQGNCRFERFTMANGRIDAAMTCTGDARAQQQAANVTLKGDFTATTFDLESRIEAAPGSGPAIKMRSKVSAKRLGECT
jgi:hypothetical protein